MRSGRVPCNQNGSWRVELRPTWGAQLVDYLTLKHDILPSGPRVGIWGYDDIVLRMSLLRHRLLNMVGNGYGSGLASMSDDDALLTAIHSCIIFNTSIR